jgi:hypothetical protein
MNVDVVDIADSYIGGCAYRADCNLAIAGSGV